MAPKDSKRLVIDASVARSAGDEKATDLTAIECRDFLKAVLRICHHVVMTVEIKDEWDRHRSRFTQRWLQSMVARRKVDNVDVLPGYDTIHEKLTARALSDKSRNAMLKDFHLVRAALATDRIVVSCDTTARDLFAATAQAVGELKAVVWVHPRDTDITGWLEAGARPEKSRLLGYTGDTE